MDSWDKREMDKKSAFVFTSVLNAVLVNLQEKYHCNKKLNFQSNRHSVIKDVKMCRSDHLTSKDPTWPGN